MIIIPACITAILFYQCGLIIYAYTEVWPYWGGLPMQMVPDGSSEVPGLLHSHLKLPAILTHNPLKQGPSSPMPVLHSFKSETKIRQYGSFNQFGNVMTSHFQYFHERHTLNWRHLQIHLKKKAFQWLLHSGICFKDNQHKNVLYSEW